MGYDLNVMISIYPQQQQHSKQQQEGKKEKDGLSMSLPFPTPLTIYELLTNYCDSTAAPHCSDLKLLGQCYMNHSNNTMLMMTKIQN